MAKTITITVGELGLNIETQGMSSLIETLSVLITATNIIQQEIVKHSVITTTPPVFDFAKKVT